MGDAQVATALDEVMHEARRLMRQPSGDRRAQVDAVLMIGEHLRRWPGLSEAARLELVRAGHKAVFGNRAFVERWMDGLAAALPGEPGQGA